MVFINIIGLLPPLLFLVVFLKMQPLAYLHMKCGLGFSNEPSRMGPASDVSSNSPVTTASSSE